MCPDTGRLSPVQLRGSPRSREGPAWAAVRVRWSAGVPGAGRAGRAAASARGRGGSARLNGLLVRAADGRPRSPRPRSRSGGFETPGEFPHAPLSGLRTICFLESAAGSKRRKEKTPTASKGSACSGLGAPWELLGSKVLIRPSLSAGPAGNVKTARGQCLGGSSGWRPGLEGSRRQDSQTRSLCLETSV